MFVIRECNTITFESLDLQSSFLICMQVYIFKRYGSSSYMSRLVKVKVKVTAAKTRPPPESPDLGAHGEKGFIAV